MRRGLIRGLAAPALWAAARPRRALALLALLAALLALGAARLGLRSDLFDWLPARDPDVRAFGRMITQLEGVAGQELVWLELVEGEPGQVTDPWALRAQAELAAFVRARVPAVTAVVGAPTWLQLADAAAGGAGVVPDSELRLRLLWGGLERALGAQLAVTLADDRRAALLGFGLAGDPRTAAARAAGVRVTEAVAEWRETSPLAARFRAELMTPVGVASGLAALDARLARDLRRLVPWSLASVALLLAWALRSARGVGATLAVLAFGALAPLGTLGWTGRPLDVVTLLIVPLLVGVGVDYPLHWWGALADARGVPAARVRRAALSAGAGLGAAALTSGAAFAGLMLSGVPGLVELGALALLGVAALLAATLLGVTALATLGAAPPPAAGGWTGAWAVRLGSALTRNRGALLAAALLLAAGAAWLLPQQRAEADVIQGNFPPDALQARAAARIRERLGSAFPEFVILEGPAAAVLPYGERALTALRGEPPVGAAARALTPAQIVGGYLALRGGLAAAAAQVLAVGGDPAALLPTDPKALQSALQALLADRAWGALGRLVLTVDTGRGSDAMLAAVVLLPERSSDDLASARALDRALVRTAVLAPPPPGVTVHALGYRTLAARFFGASVRALAWLGVAGALVGGALAAAAAQRGARRQAAAATLGAIALGTLLWGGALPLLGVPLTLFLLLPLALVVGVGADHALHLLLAPPRDRWRGAGARVLLAAATTALAFLPFALPGLGAELPSLAQVARAALAAAATSLAAALVGVAAVDTGG